MIVPLDDLSASELNAAIDDTNFPRNEDEINEPKKALKKLSGLTNGTTSNGTTNGIANGTTNGTEHVRSARRTSASLGIFINQFLIVKI